MTVFNQPQLVKPGRPAALPAGRSLEITAVDGTRLHAEVFGPEHGQPIVLAHGITCAIGVWGNQIADLATDYRVIAYDHRGHGQSGAPKGRNKYNLDFLAADLDAVLTAVLKPGERAVLAGHSMGGIAITSWAQRYPQRVTECVDAVALINTTTGDLLKLVQLLQVPNPLATSRAYAAGRLLKTFGGVSLVPGSRTAARQFVAMIAVGHDADPAVVDYVFELFEGTSAAGRRGWVSALVDNLNGHHIGLDNLTVPALVIGSAKDRLLPIAASRRIARNVSNLWSFVELGGGHCAILERPDEVNQQLRALLVGSAHSSTA
ncbi:alpha/beta hydrolase [Mycobacterium sp. CBMA293]|uniref:alpha/beta fold hydrolase n=1 Tax=unclassified Mycolicibacterium TaxID=2636767 RepID=UPI0012DD4C83|nr:MULTISPECIES: alpha/beta hydrolase [unclassified Mycolicibacterium]MUL46417.1 alpha/beta hydrolase [Mycolicibacterium sp. CBMA 360]MUL57071.1 alpha/beta hydrolase [Mycolicibacterium sp. CBMA 335]MUL70111.1 alpha/beta hydrolase [Mycolicibacterium sp. CBMA 311]MUL92159.1 alpha/beta hydrolase [Mycolicibacterium sp. CBMA 230]MUM05898.1 alpha/beta hydrolase [Mycolicibacterium sp. CBMA 213]